MDKQIQNNQIITIPLVLIAIAFSIMLYKTYKTKRTQNISYYLLSFLLLIETIALYILLRNHMSFTTIALLIATIYFMMGTLYILYIKQLYADEETIEKRLEEKDIINISKIEDIC
jgi:hypothetical protein